MASSWAKILGVLHALTLLKFLTVATLLVALVTTGGAGRFPASVAQNLPPWAQNKLTPAGSEVVLEDAGVLPFFIASQVEANSIHAGLGRLGMFWATIFPTLRNNLGALSTLLAGLLLVAFFAWLIRQFRRRMIVRGACGVAASLRRQIHRQMYRLGQSSLPTEGTSPVVNLFTREVNDIRDGLIADLEFGWRTPTLIVGLLLLALGISPVSTLFILALGALVGYSVRYLDASARARSVSATRDAAIQLCLLQEDLGRLRTVRVHGIEEVDRHRFDEHLERFEEADARRLLSETRISPSTRLLIVAAGLVAVGLLSYGVVVKGNSAASALALIVASAGLIAPVLEFQSRKKALAQASRASSAIFEYLDRSSELLQNAGAQFLQPIQKKISFENVTLTNSSGKTLLEGLSLEIPAKSRTSILCLDQEASEALVCLIPRLIDPEVGRVRIDGIDLREVTLESIRAQVSTVLQADLVFTDSVFNNIGLGDASFDLPKIIAAAKVAHAHQFIQDLPDGYDTVIGPLGQYLTTDQQYRIALARAYLHDPSTVLIEEPSTPLGDEVKQLLDDTITRLAVNRTLIFIPHRQSTIRSSDQIVVLNKGRVEAVGSPNEVHQASKLYRHIQYLEFNPYVRSDVEPELVPA